MEKTEIEQKLLAQAPIEWQRFQRRKKKLIKGKSRVQRDMENIKTRVDELTRKHHLHNPHLREIEKKLMDQRKPEGTSKLFCPKCKGGDQGNVMNGEPWCFKCNTMLISRKKAGKHRKQHDIRPIRKATAMRSELDRLNPGLNPKNEEE